jgi:hypothetical protein
VKIFARIFFHWEGDGVQSGSSAISSTPASHDLNSRSDVDCGSFGVGATALDVFFGAAIIVSLTN